jgi:hypothetical protein
MVEELVLSGADVVKCGIGPGLIFLVFVYLLNMYIFR